MLHKAVYCFRCVRVWFFVHRPEAGSPKATLKFGDAGDNNTAGVWFHRPSTVVVFTCICILCSFAVFVLLRPSNLNRLHLDLLLRKHQHINHLVQHWWPGQPARFECFVKRSAGNHGSPYVYALSVLYIYEIQIMETLKDPGLWHYAAELPLSSPGRVARTFFCPLSQEYGKENTIIRSLSNLSAEYPCSTTTHRSGQGFVWPSAWSHSFWAKPSKLLTPKQQMFLQSIPPWPKDTKGNTKQLLNNSTSTSTPNYSVCVPLGRRNPATCWKLRKYPCFCQLPSKHCKYM